MLRFVPIEKEWAQYFLHSTVEANVTSFMERYYLLRNNIESGPFTLRELNNQKLFIADLFWVEEESTCWKQAAEIPTLAACKILENPVRQPVVLDRKTGIADAIKGSYSASTTDRSKATSCEEEVVAPSFEALKLKYGKKAPQRRAWRKSLNVGANLLGLTTFVMGVMMAAFMIKKAVDNIEFPPMVATAQTEEIQPETVLESTTQHAAFAGPTPIAKAEPARQTELVDQQEPHLPEMPAVNATKQAVNNAEGLPQGYSATPETETEKQLKEAAEKEAIKADAKDDEKPAEQKPGPEINAEKSSGKPSLTLSANQYKVGFLGGISNLEIAVSNPSSQTISKAVVEVEYLKPNGKIAASQTVVVSGITPGSLKKISVPDNSRGVTVRYRVVNVES